MIKETPLQIKYKQDKAKLAAKRELKAFESLTDKDRVRVAESLTTTAFALSILNFETEKLRNIGLLDNRALIINSMVQYKMLEDFFYSIAKKKGVLSDFERNQNNIDDFLFRFVHATADERERTMKFLESIQNKRK